MFKRKLQDLSAFDRKRLHIENAELTLTQRCNLQCKHCMRGGAKAFDITPEVLDAFFGNVAEVGNLSLGGGEISLVPHLVREVLLSAKRNGTLIKALNITTNGSRFSKDLADILLEFKDYIDVCMVTGGYWDIGNFDISIRVSLDNFHLEELLINKGMSIHEILDNIKAYQDILGENRVVAGYGSDYEIINEGRAKAAKTNVPKIKSSIYNAIPYYEGDRGIIIGGVIDISCAGDVVPINIAFNREQELSAGNIKEEKLSSILQRMHLIRTKSLEEYDKKNIQVLKRTSLSDINIKRYKKSDRFETRQMIETLLIARGQHLKEDYEIFTFE